MMGTGFDIKAFYAEVDRLYREAQGDKALRFLESSLEQARSLGDMDALIVVASELGGALRVRGEYECALALYHDALDAFAHWDHATPESHSNLLINMGDVLVASRRYREAIDVFNEAERIQAGGPCDDYQLSAICNNRSAAYRELGRFEAARRDLKRAIQLLGDNPAWQGNRAVTTIGLAQILVKEGQLEKADQVISGALELYESLTGGRDIHRPNALATAAEIAYLRGDYTRAASCYRMAAELLKDKLGDSQTVEQLTREQMRMERLASHIKEQR